MGEVARRIPIDKDSDLGRQLDDAREAGQTVVLEVNGHSYRLTLQPQVSDDPWKSYNPDRARRALAESAGASKGVNREQLLRDIYAARSQDSHGRPA